MPAKNDLLTIGEVAARSGHAASAIRFYEAEGLISAARTPGGQRVSPPRPATSRLHLLGAEARAHPAGDRGRARGPAGRSGAHEGGWARLSRAWQGGLDDRIAELERLRETLTSCIGCGCLSVATCGLFNTGDAAARRGAGARYLLGDDPDEVVQEARQAHR